LTSIIILITLKNFIASTQEGVSNSITSIIKKWLILFVIFGFGFSNHLMTLYLLPSTLLLYFFCEGLNKKSILAVCSLFVITGTVSSVFYILLMLRASTNPPWSYGDPSTLKSLFDHVTAKEYSKYMMQGFDSIKEQGSVLLKMLSVDFSKEKFSTGEFSLSFIPGITGLLLMFLFRKEVAIYFILIILVSITLAFSYKIPDINEYFLVPFMIISILSIVTLFFILKLIGNNKIIVISFGIVLLFFISTEFIINYSYANRSDDYIYKDFYKASVSDLPENSILMTDKWSIFISPGLYFQNIENFRKDVTIISPYAAIFNNWYNKSLDVQALDSNRVVIKRNNLFVGFDFVLKPLSAGIISLPPGSVLIPYPYYYRVVFDDAYYPLDEFELNIRFKDKPYNAFDAYIYSLIPFMLEQRIIYELSYNEINKASYFYELI